MTINKGQRISEYIEHILEATARIEAYVEGSGYTAFAKNTLVQDAVIRNLEIVGEAAHKIQIADPSLSQRHPHIKLDLAYRMRNLLIHGYDAVNLLTIWNTIKSDLPVLKQDIIAVRSIIE